MQTIDLFFATLPVIPIEHMVALIALVGLGLAIFAIYVVFNLAKEQQGK